MVFSMVGSQMFLDIPSAPNDGSRESSEIWRSHGFPVPYLYINYVPSWLWGFPLLIPKATAKPDSGLATLLGRPVLKILFSDPC